MGRVNSPEVPQQSTPLTTIHFSHPHSLNLINHQQTLTLPSSCSACKLNIPSERNMGRVNSSEVPQKSTPLTTIHFSHPHPLNLINYQQTLTLTPTPPPSSCCCSACKLNPSGMIYSCTTCNFFLHKNCFEMPRKITHPFHKDHSLTLLPKPDYSDGLFKCDGCGETGDGFSYNCKPCGLDLHILCAVMPLSVTYVSHAHKLDLTFEPPYGTNDFCCDICKRNGSNNWLYRCSLCGFDAHLNCARGVQQINRTNYNFTGFDQSSQGAQTTSSRSAPLPQIAPGWGPMHQNFMMNNAAVGVPSGVPPFMGPFGVNRQNHDMAMEAAIQQMANNTNAMAVAMLTAGTERGTQQFMAQLASGLNNNGGGSGLINAISGGGGQNNALQALMGGGGGGGMDVLQSLMGGGDGVNLVGSLLGGPLGGFL
ncbi:hypothetical protein BUALT_Bualt01G0175900 [Buddleja alternifolia]|uniref:DC1 domain-containing protein n=1 Tax=Buddleja alternifolia TaxID=168488 RepID=A0AAV6Y9K3_9LAMI|nr:hypothetical protein BUALT_Bualt01G0175900 [Buddleja alternifolia]